MTRSILSLALVAQTALAYPWVAQQQGVDTSLFSKARRAAQPGSAAACPYNPNHVAAAPVTSTYPYNSAINGLPGKGIGGYQVPAPGDTAHQFVPPGKNDIRGPCPGLNAAANHNFLAHDGITNFNELVDAQQNVYNVGYNLAVLLAVAGIATGDGDLVTEKLSIGCDATTRTSPAPALTGTEYGLDGHNRFEADASLTRNDYFLANGDDFTLNTTLFKEMDTTCNHNFDVTGLSKYRKQRYQESLSTNGNFNFSPLTLLLYGAASFLYELMPSGPNYTPDLATISSFFGVTQDSTGKFVATSGEQIPANWTNRVIPYDNTLVTIQILEMYLLNPVAFGANTGSPNSFNGLNTSGFKNGQLVNATPQGVLCLLYQQVAGAFVSDTAGIAAPIVGAAQYVANKLGPEYANLGCPIPLT